MGLFGGSSKEKKGEVIDLGRKVGEVEEKEKNKGKDFQASNKGEKGQRLALLSSIVERSGGLREVDEAKDSVSSLILKWAVEKPWLVELQMLKLYGGVGPKDSKKSIEMFSGEVKYLKKKIKSMRSEIKGADEIDRDEQSLVLKNLKKFLKALEQIEAYLANLMALSDKERKNLHNVAKGDLSRAQKKVLKDEKSVGIRKEFLTGKVKEDEALRAKMKKIAQAA